MFYAACCHTILPFSFTGTPLLEGHVSACTPACHRFSSWDLVFMLGLICRLVFTLHTHLYFSLLVFFPNLCTYLPYSPAPHIFTHLQFGSSHWEATPALPPSHPSGTEPSHLPACGTGDAFPVPVYCALHGDSYYYYLYFFVWLLHSSGTGL